MGILTQSNRQLQLLWSLPSIAHASGDNTTLCSYQCNLPLCCWANLAAVAVAACAATVWWYAAAPAYVLRLAEENHLSKQCVLKLCCLLRFAACLHHCLEQPPPGVQGLEEVSLRQQRPRVQLQDQHTNTPQPSVTRRVTVLSGD